MLGKKSITAARKHWHAILMCGDAAPPFAAIIYIPRDLTISAMSKGSS